MALLPLLLGVFVSMFDDVIVDVRGMHVVLLCGEHAERVGSLAGQRYGELGLPALRLLDHLQFLLDARRPGESPAEPDRLRVSDLDDQRGCALAELLDERVVVGDRLETEFGEGGTRTGHDGGAGGRGRGTADGRTARAAAAAAGLVAGVDRGRRRAVGGRDVDRTGDERAVEEVLADVRDDALVGRVLRRRVDVEAELADVRRSHSDADDVFLELVRHKPVPASAASTSQTATTPRPQTSIRTPDCATLLQLSLSRSGKMPLIIPGFRSAPFRSNGLLTMRHPTAPKKFHKNWSTISSVFSKIRTNSPCPAMEKTPL